MSANPIKILLSARPRRSIALCTNTHALIFRQTSSSSAHAAAPTYSTNLPYNTSGSGGASSSLPNIRTSLSDGGVAPKCQVEFSSLDNVDLSSYRPMGSAMPCRGTLGLITVNRDVFLCVVTGASHVATVRPGETVYRIHAVEFHCLNRADFDNMSLDEIYPSQGGDHDYPGRYGEGVYEHPCAALRKMLSEGTFYYSVDFDLTNRLQSRSVDHNSRSTHFSIDSFNEAFLWNNALIKPLLEFRSRLSPADRLALDTTRLLTSAIRGFVESVNVSRASVRAGGSANSGSGNTLLTIISRLSCMRAGTRFNSRGIDDDGHVANFVETETILWDSRTTGNVKGLGFSYVQVRGSVPIFWEQQPGLLPGQQKITVTRSGDATQPAFDKHMEGMHLKYGSTHIVNLLSALKPGEAELTRMFRIMVKHSPLVESNDKRSTSEQLKETEFDFHEETRGGYEAASLIERYINSSADAFAYFLTEDIDNEKASGLASQVILQQEGVFRTNCLDCLDRTNLVQQIISRMAITKFMRQKSESPQEELWFRHKTLWADNGDALSRIYAGTGALKSSFTRSGKMSLAGALADVKKSAKRIYINNFEDKGRQVTIDMLLGRLVGQEPVILYDPLNDYVNYELSKRAVEFSSSQNIRIHVGTLNLNGRTNGIHEDLTSWLFPPPCPMQQPELVVVGFQEIVELSAQQIMSTDPARRQDWEAAVLRSINGAARKLKGGKEYVMLRGGQLVGAALGIYVRSDVLTNVKNVEGSIKKTGMSGLAGNKGAVAIRLEYENTRMCFVTAHLAAGFANYEERNRDYRTISTGLRFQHGRLIDDHDVVIWLGDFNYRVTMANEDVRALVAARDLMSLYENDQLNLQMIAGQTFPYYSESQLTFLPTYRFDIGTDRYDTSEKQRIPAWCDRILRKGSNIKQLTYNSAPLMFSDHRPVYATFDVMVSIVNQDLKDKLSMQIYQQRRKQLGNRRTQTPDETDSEEDLLEYEPVAPGHNGLPARSQVKPPDDSYVLNTNRPSNPFTPTDAKDWVKKTPPAPPPARGQRAKDTDSLPSARSTTAGLQRVNSSASARSIQTVCRRLPPPFDPNTLPRIGNQVLPPPRPRSAGEKSKTWASEPKPKPSVNILTKPRPNTDALIKPLTPTPPAPRTTTTTTTTTTTATVERKPSVASTISKVPPPSVPKKPVHLVSGAQSPSIGSTASPPTSPASQKQALVPSVPRKGANLAGGALAGNNPLPPPTSARTIVPQKFPPPPTSGSRATPPQGVPPPPLRPQQQQNRQQPEPQQKPLLPKRTMTVAANEYSPTPSSQTRPTNDLLDGGPDNNSAQMKGWKPLKPGS